AAVHDIAAVKIGFLTRDARIVSPVQLSGDAIKGVHDAPRTGRVDDATGDNRRGFESARSAEFLAPDQAEPGNGLLVDLVQRAKTLICLRTSVQRPVLLGSR